MDPGLGTNDELLGDPIEKKLEVLLFGNTPTNRKRTETWDYNRMMRKR